MERLTEREPYWLGEEFWTSAKEPDDEEIDNVYSKLKEYEDLEEQGLLLRLPCKVGDTVYIPFLNRIMEKRVLSIIVQRSFIVVYCENNNYPFSSEDFGKTVFLTKEEAEAKLKELEGSEEE